MLTSAPYTLATDLTITYRRPASSKQRTLIIFALFILAFVTVFTTRDFRPPLVYETLEFEYNATVLNKTVYNASDSLGSTKIFNHLAGESRNQKIAVIMASDGNLNTYGFRNITAHGFFNRSIENKREFAMLHGYMLILDGIRDKTRPATWSKILTLMWTMETFPHIDWLWWVDVDTIIMQPQLSLESHLLSRLNSNSSKIDLIMCKDMNGITAGSFLIRNSDWSRFFLDVVYDHVFSDLTSHLAPGFEHHEQSTFQHLYSTHEHVRKHVFIVDQSLLNAYPNRDGTINLDFLVHFAACSIHQDCDDKFEKFWRHRLPIEEARSKKACLDTKEC